MALRRPLGLGLTLLPPPPPLKLPGGLLQPPMLMQPRRLLQPPMQPPMQPRSRRCNGSDFIVSLDAF
jgi:hypothetical protein